MAASSRSPVFVLVASLMVERGGEGERYERRRGRFPRVKSAVALNVVCGPFLLDGIEFDRIFAVAICVCVKRAKVSRVK